MWIQTQKTIIVLILLASCRSENQHQESQNSSLLVNLSPHQTKLLSVLEKATPALWPKRPTCKPRIMPAFRLRSILGNEAADALICYTSGTCAEIHAVDALSNDELEKKGYTSSRIAELRAMSGKIAKGLARAPLSGGNAYRVIKSVPAESVADLIEHWQDRKPIGLGEGFRPALASASWNTSFLERRLSQDPPSNYNLLYVISSHNGVAIEELSPYPQEGEIVLPSSEKFIIEEIAPLVDRQRTLRIDIKSFSELKKSKTESNQNSVE
jgi:hypothetical protein